MDKEERGRREEEGGGRRGKEEEEDTRLMSEEKGMERGVGKGGRIKICCSLSLTSSSLSIVALICSDPGVTVNAALQTQVRCKFLRPWNNSL